MKYVIFQISGESFGVDIQSAVSIEKRLPITRVPLAPDYLVGVINLRGEIIPIINPSALLKQDDGGDLSNFHKVLIVSREDYKIGLLIGNEVSIVDIDEHLIQRDAVDLSESDKMYISGIIRHQERIVNILNVEKLTTPEKVMI
ncbi:chemotaxis protein CheW [Caldanaerobius polysaccharolyticus]|uniref:chemotaxis protein CheW n=1 Tax=Caldanaerobius polysaccharolyticus TaxID=44256 RepID=UPI00047AB54F|nr:chemotaxis protein CheW [Caldanaerobius polysaccharolyticus]